MSFAIFVDGSSNLPKSKLDGIEMLPCSYTIDDVPQQYTGDLDSFNAHEYYTSMKEGKKIKTTLVNTHTILTYLRPVLQTGRDAVYISMSSGISGTYQAAKIAAEELMEDFPDRLVHIVDSRG